MRKPKLRLPRALTGTGLVLAGAGLVGSSLTYLAVQNASADDAVSTTTPIKHVVVLFDENISFDHYFGTYPYAKNDADETDAPTFTAATGTEVPNNYKADSTLISANPNSTKPFRLGWDDRWTCSQNHNYTPEQEAVDGGKMDLFPENTNGSCTASSGPSGAAENMGYYDGNVVTGMWNLAQNYALGDNSWDVTFGPSTPGALNVVSGQTYGGIAYDSTSDDSDPTAASSQTASGFSAVDSSTGIGTVIGDPDPVYDDCSDTNHTASSNTVGMQGENVGDLLNEKNITWGWFQGGFTPTADYDPDSDVNYAVCGSTHTNINGNTVTDYSPHHNPFAYYKSTSNPHHYPGTDGVTIGADDPTNDDTKTGANHNYDLSVFEDAVANDELPAVSYVKAAAYEDAHPSNSDPIDEQDFLIREINAIESSPEWKSTAIVIAYDDSDGWYDHEAPTIVNPSSTSDDADICTAAAQTADPIAGEEDRCGPSQRLPMLVISPYARTNYIDHTKLSQASVVKFIEDNWGLGQISDDYGDGAVNDSFDTDSTIGDLTSMFDFQDPTGRTVSFNDDGTVASATDIKVTPAGGYAASMSASVPRLTYGKAGTVTAKVTSDGDPNGGVVETKIDGKVVSDTAVKGTSAKIKLPTTLTAGKHTLKLAYQGSADTKAGATVSKTITVAKASSKVSAKAGKVKKNRTVVTVKVTEPGSSLAPGGKVSGTVNGKRIAAKSLKHGKATFSVTVKKGRNVLVFTYAGDANHTSAKSGKITVRD
ncbi:MAG: alkaline phosphatase family protein [Nocardioides sp.]|uniref:alkaline phosphatase family protein n=1 Tax=Nocardioides sp. TaxID=35761 RepID=UPI0039E437E0